ncbi:MAG: AGE family epimerase/isomerase [Bacteroidales bacterium]|nr:AGE family epimerase/isomerase [Bacteroidales bacterium]
MKQPFLLSTLLFCCIISLVYSKQKTTDIYIPSLIDIQHKSDELGQNIINFWINKGLDTVSGGFYGTLDKEGKPISPNNKGIIAMSRHLWAFSSWHELKGQNPEIEKICHNLYQYIIDNFYDSTNGEFHWLIDETGNIIDSKKRLYSQSFAIYGLSKYAMVFNKQEAAQYALNCFKVIDKRAHDPVYGGYDQTNEPDWVVNGANKETNTQIHLLESFTSLYKLTKDSLVKARLEEMIEIVAYKICQPSGYAHLQFKSDWSPVGRPAVSYGHDLETAWLLYEAAKVLNKNSDSLLIKQIVKLATLSAVEGYDTKNGGYFYSGIPLKKVINKSKVWWVQAEGLLGLLRLYIITNNSEWLIKLDNTMKWTETQQLNKYTGEWYWDLDKKGKTITTSNMATEWKVSYHNLRSMLFINEWINNELENQ